MELAPCGGRTESIFKNIEKSRTMKTPVPNKALFFRFCWWNGGGKIRSRLKTNPLLGKLLLKEPDVFIYGEAETPSPSNLNVNGPPS